MKMLILTMFLKGFASPSGRRKFVCFLCVFDDFDGNCAKVHADSEDYCESLDMWSTSMKLG
jgi:hypothetical protein